MRRRIWIAASPAVLLLASCGRPAGAEPGGEAIEPMAVRVAPVIEDTVSRPVFAAGTLEPKDEIALSFKTAGVIARVFVDAGDPVRAGDTLATLDLGEIEARVARATSAAEKAERDLTRAIRLHADSVYTQARLEDAETAAELARADLETALFNLRYSVIRAPASGVVLRRIAEPGELVAPGAPVLVLGSSARGAVMRVGLADRDFVRVRRGDPARVRFNALPGQVFAGAVADIAAAADPGTGTYTVEVAMQDAARLPAGLVGTVEISPASGVPAKLIPIEAVLEADDRNATVYALSSDGTRAERRRVTIAFIADGRAAVTSGLEHVDSVLTDGAAWVRDGAAVRVLR